MEEGPEKASVYKPIVIIQSRDDEVSTQNAAAEMESGNKIPDRIYHTLEQTW